MNNEDKPKSPVRRGVRGCLIGRLNVRYPNIPARKKTSKAFRNLSSLKIEYNEKKIKMKGIDVFIKLKTDGRSIMKNGLMINAMNIPIKEPYIASTAASKPLPS